MKGLISCLSLGPHTMSGGPRFCINYTAIITDRVDVREEETERQIGKQKKTHRERQRNTESEIALTILQ